MHITYIPGIRWMKSSSEDRFLEIANRLVEEGIDEDEVLEMMSELFYAVAHEYED